MQQKYRKTALVSLALSVVLVNLSAPQSAAANELAIFEDFDDLAGWSIVSPGTVEIAPASELHFLDTSGSNNAAYRLDVSVPDRYVFEFGGRINQYSSTDKDALGVRIRDGAYKFEIMFRNGGLYALKSDGLGGLLLVEIDSNIDTSNHTYRAEIVEGTAKVYADGQLLSEYDMPADSTADIVYFWCKGAPGNASESHVTSINQIDTGTELSHRPEFFSVFDSIPASTVAQGSGTLTYTDTYAPSATSWTAYNLDPTDVWQATLQHDESTSSRDWDIRIGRGGQIYSFRTDAGELIPPQEHKGAEWIDEVFQAVTVNTLTNNRDPNAYPSRSFLHQSGTYWLKNYLGVEEELDPSYLNHSWYSPKLASYYDSTDKSYATLVWGQYSHVPSVYDSRQLIYTKLEDKGDGVIEFTYVVTNRGTDTINWLNLPWGGVRESNMPVQILSNTDGTYSQHDSVYGKRSIPAEPDDMGIFNHQDTGGWFAWTASNSSSANALGIVFGEDPHWDPVNGDYHWNQAHFKWGRVNSATRDYNVGVNVFPVKIAPGESFYYRGYMVIGTLGHVAAKANTLKSEVDYGILTIDETQGATYDYAQLSATRNGVTQTVLQTAQTTTDLSVFTDPVDDSVPLFLMENTVTGNSFISDNPHETSTITSYVNPYQGYLAEEWDSLSAWTVNTNQGVVEIDPTSELHLKDTSGNTNSVYSYNIDTPELYRVRFEANVNSFGQTGSDSLGVRVRNGFTRFEVKFRNTDLYIVQEGGSGLDLVQANIPTDEWHTYEWIVKHNSLEDYYWVNLIFDGALVETVVNGAAVPVSFRLPKDSSSDLVYLWVNGDSTVSESRTRNLDIEDVFYAQLTNQNQYRAYDGNTKYLGFLGYAMPENHTSSTLTYQNLDQALTDGTYYPNPEGLSLKVLD